MSNGEVDLLDDMTLPTLWLLGKSGAGKSSLVQKLTVSTDAELGSGFRPCTPTTRAYEFPSTMPLVRFLDTRGIDEASFDSMPELAKLSAISQAVIVVSKLGDPAQNSIIAMLRGLKALRPSTSAKELCVVHTHIDEIEDERNRRRLRHENHSKFEAAWGSELPFCCVDLSHPHNSDALGSDSLIGMLNDLIPDTIQVFEALRLRQEEAAGFAEIRSKVSRYAAAAAASDTVPLAGLITVPAIQGKMMLSIAEACGVTWDGRLISEFATALGSSAAAKYALHLSTRQLVKAIPVWGQTLGATLAATTSYATTFALGRTLFRYLYNRSRGRIIDTNEVQLVYREALAAMTSRTRLASNKAD